MTIDAVKAGTQYLSLKTILTSSLIGYVTFVFSKKHELDKTLFPYCPSIIGAFVIFYQQGWSSTFQSLLGACVASLSFTACQKIASKDD